MTKSSTQLVLFALLFLFAIGLEVQALNTSVSCTENKPCLETCVHICVRVRLWECKSGFCICECYPGSMM
ncbi:hypothetical protein Lalb_Chr11g0069711 [Lupinus albus]|uniref:Knottin, scorpion toxin n=1 Tax=Lupinus albus TaxID=3870 RepID=A0A6A4PSA2_LUPAL|nr:hypothetical protein Lalb_Chr11g0069711 [Lupinus albus]